MSDLDAITEAFKIFWPILLAVISFAIGAIGYLLKDVRSNNKEHQEKQDKEIEKVRDELSSFKSTLPHTYVLRDDFLRAISCLDMKVDTIARDVGELNKNVSKLIATGGSERE